MTVASMAVDMSDGPRDESPSPLWFGIIAFGRYAEALPLSPLAGKALPRTIPQAAKSRAVLAQ